MGAGEHDLPTVAEEEVSPASLPASVLAEGEHGDITEGGGEHSLGVASVAAARGVAGRAARQARPSRQERSVRQLAAPRRVKLGREQTKPMGDCIGDMSPELRELRAPRTPLAVTPQRRWSAGDADAAAARGKPAAAGGAARPSSAPEAVPHLPMLGGMRRRNSSPTVPAGLSPARAFRLTPRPGGLVERTAEGQQPHLAGSPAAWRTDRRLKAWSKAVDRRERSRQETQFARAKADMRYINERKERQHELITTGQERFNSERLQADRLAWFKNSKRRGLRTFGAVVRGWHQVAHESSSHAVQAAA